MHPFTGNVQYFVGQFYASLKSFEKAVKFRDRAVKVKTMEHAKNYLMLGLSQFRVGESGEYPCSANIIEYYQYIKSNSL